MVEPARVIAVHRDSCILQFPHTECPATITGRFRLGAQTAADFPVVGDWVQAEIVGPNLAVIHSLQPRTTTLSRKTSGTVIEQQVMAANVDVVFIVTSFNDDFNLRRLERYLALTRQAGITLVFLINKGDLAAADDGRLAQARTLLGPAVHSVSALSGDGLNVITEQLTKGKVGIFLGSSGVGKSTLLNALMGRLIQPTQTIREDDGKGRHTTTARQMFTLENGGFIIDTPGLREIQLWADEDILPEAFTDVGALAAACQFNDCRHATEPGCAVRAALEAGTLDAARWAGYQKLQKELAYLKRKTDPKEQANTKKRWKKIHKELRARNKEEYD